MLNYITKLLVGLSLLTCVDYARASSPDYDQRRLDQSLDELDELLAERPKYLDRRKNALVTLKNSRTGTEVERLEAVGRSYMQFDNDSALTYIARARDIAHGSDLWRLMSLHAQLLPLAGFIQQAVDEYDAIPVDSLDEKGLIDYYDNGRLLYANITSFYAYYPDEALKWSAKVLDSHEKLLALLDKDKSSPRYRVNYGEYLLRSRQPVQAETLLREVFETEPDGSHHKSRAAHILSHIAQQQGDSIRQAYYLINAVTHDIYAGDMDLPSLQDLGEMRYRSGDVDRAYRYLNIALQNGLESKSLMRTIQASRSLPTITEAHTLAIEKWSTRLYIVITVLAVALVILVITTVISRRRLYKMRAMQQRLTEANRTKEVYISQFLSLCSIYMDKLTQFAKTVNRKLTAGKSEEVLRMTRSGKYLEEQNIEFYDTFDNAFLHIFPTFPERVNDLLRPEEQITLRENEKMNTDLRILAFMRLGIDDSSQIARILNYSLNTIYTYRNKLKTKAINRDTFEQDIMKIDSI